MFLLKRKFQTIVAFFVRYLMCSLVYTEQQACLLQCDGLYFIILDDISNDYSCLKYHLLQNLLVNTTTW